MHVNEIFLAIGESRVCVVSRVMMTSLQLKSCLKAIKASVEVDKEVEGLMCLLIQLQLLNHLLNLVVVDQHLDDCVTNAVDDVTTSYLLPNSLLNIFISNFLTFEFNVKKKEALFVCDVTMTSPLALCNHPF